MNLFINRITIFLLSSLVAGYAVSKEECYYNPDAVNYEYFLKHTNFTNAQWDSKKKEAKIILDKENEEIIVSYSACYQFGLTATYKMKRSAEKLNSVFLIKKLTWLGNKVLNKPDYEMLETALNNKRFINDLDQIETKERVFIGIEGSDYQSFLVYVVNDKDDFYVEISWYM